MCINNTQRGNDICAFYNELHNALGLNYYFRVTLVFNILMYDCEFVVFEINTLNFFLILQEDISNQVIKCKTSLVK